MFQSDGSNAGSMQTYAVIPRGMAAEDNTLVSGLRYDYHSQYKDTPVCLQWLSRSPVCHPGGYSRFPSPTLRSYIPTGFTRTAARLQIIGKKEMKAESNNFNLSAEVSTGKTVNNSHDAIFVSSINRRSAPYGSITIR